MLLFCLIIKEADAEKEVLKKAKKEKKLGEVYGRGGNKLPENRTAAKEARAKEIEAAKDDFNFKRLTEIPGDLGAYLRDMFIALPGEWAKGVATGYIELGMKQIKEEFAHDPNFGGQMDKDIAAKYGIELKLDDEGEPINFLGLVDKEDGTLSDLFENFKANVGNGKIWANIATGVLQNKNDGEAPSIFQCIEDKIDEAYEPLKAKVIRLYQKEYGRDSGPDLDAMIEKIDKAQKDAKEAAIEAAKQETERQIKEKIGPNKAAILKANPNLTEEELAGMDLIRIKEVLAKTPMPQTEESLRDYLSEAAKDLPDGWLKVLTTLKPSMMKEDLSLEDYWLPGFIRIKTQKMFKDQAFVADVLSDAIHRPYTYTDSSGQAKTARVDFDARKVTTTYRSWLQIQELMKPTTVEQD
jgi:hypothetical protein